MTDSSVADTATQEAEGWGEAHIIEHHGSRIHYWLAGPADGPLVVLTHGASMDHRMFAEQRPALVDAGYRVLAWDVRGHGLSKPIGSPFTVATVAEDLRALVDRVGVDEVVLVGHSFGGYVSQLFCYRWPDSVTALVVIGSTDITRALPRHHALLLQISPYFWRLWPDFRRRRVVSKYSAKDPEVKAYVADATSRLSKREFVTVWSAVANAAADGHPSDIQCPVLITHGDSDIVGPIPEESRIWAERAPTSEYAEIPDAGHNANQDNPEATNALLLEFLDEHVPVS